MQRKPEKDEGDAKKRDRERLTDFSTLIDGLLRSTEALEEYAEYLQNLVQLPETKVTRKSYKVEALSWKLVVASAMYMGVTGRPPSIDFLSCCLDAKKYEITRARHALLKKEEIRIFTPTERDMGFTRIRAREPDGALVGKTIRTAPTRDLKALGRRRDVERVQGRPRKLVSVEFTDMIGASLDYRLEHVGEEYLLSVPALDAFTLECKALCKLILAFAKSSKILEESIRPWNFIQALEKHEPEVYGRLADVDGMREALDFRLNELTTPEIIQRFENEYIPKMNRETMRSSMTEMIRRRNEPKDFKIYQNAAGVGVFRCLCGVDVQIPHPKYEGEILCKVCGGAYTIQNARMHQMRD